MVAMEEVKIDVVVKIKREKVKKDEPPKLHTDLPASITFCVTFYFYFENAKIWVGRTTLNRGKKGMALLIRLNTPYI